MEITYNRFIRKPLYNSQHYFIYGEEIILRDELISLIKQYFKNKEFHNVVTLGITSFDNLIFAFLVSANLTFFNKASLPQSVDAKADKQP